MKIIPSSRKNRDIAVAIIFLAVIALSVWLLSWLSARYNLTISSTEGGEGTTPGEGTFTYAEGTVVNLVAEAEEGYYFVNWTGDVSAITDVNANATSITMNGHYSINANFGLEIRDWYDLDTVRDNLDGHHFLVNDLDSTTPGYEELASPTANGGKGWESIGFLGGSASFTGIFDGQGHEIHDLFVNRPDQFRNAGLFGMIDHGVVENLGVVNVTVIGSNSVGGLVGLNKGTISNSYSTGSVTGNGQAIGGLVGQNYDGTVSNSYSTSNVTANKRVGGLVGQHYGGTVSNSYSTGSVIGNEYVGGVVGSNGNSGNVGYSYSTGNVTGDKWVGGVVGYIGSGSTVSNSYSSGSVYGGDYVGGLVGRSYGGTVSNSYFTGSVTGGDHAGGLVGSNWNCGTVSNSYSTGIVSGDSSVGGLLGANDGTVSNSFWDTETSGQAMSDGGTGKNTTEMQDIATFSGAAWDIIAVAPGSTNTTHIWNIVNNVTYPFLSWQS